jgi:D-alanine-D-alanine ligase
MTTIGLAYDLRTDYIAEGFLPEQVAEFDSEETIEALAQTLGSLGFEVCRIGHGRSLCQRLSQGDRWDLVFNVAEGLRGRSREAQVPAILELFDIPYTFSDPLVCAATLDKAVAKRLVSAAGVRTPAFTVVNDVTGFVDGHLRYPLFAKPLAEGTGKGIEAISRVDSPEELPSICATLLKRFRQPVLVEEYLPGREFTTAILGTGDEASPLGTMEIEILAAEGNAIYSLEMKEQCEQHVRYSRLAPGSLRDEVHELALEAYRTLDCRDAARVDVRLDADGRPCFLEVNPLPGLHPTHSDLPMIATWEHMPYRDLIGRIVDSAMARTNQDAHHVA